MKPAILRLAQEAAEQRHVTFTRFLEDAVCVALKADAQTKTIRKKAIRLPTFSSALLPGVDLNSSASLLARMGDDDPV